MQLSHIKVNNKKGTASFLGANSFNRKCKLLAGLLMNGYEEALRRTDASSWIAFSRTDASTLGRDVRVIPVTLGDQNLTYEEVRHPTFSSRFRHALQVVACKGHRDNAGRLHQDLIIVTEPLRHVTLQPLDSDVKGFDGVHQAVRARIIRNSNVGQAAASTRGARDSTHGPTTNRPVSAEAATAAASSAAASGRVDEEALAGTWRRGIWPVSAPRPPPPPEEAPAGAWPVQVDEHQDSSQRPPFFIGPSESESRPASAPRPPPPGPAGPVPSESRVVEVLEALARAWPVLDAESARFRWENRIRSDGNENLGDPDDHASTEVDPTPQPAVASLGVGLAPRLGVGLATAEQILTTVNEDVIDNAELRDDEATVAQAVRRIGGSDAQLVLEEEDEHQEGAQPEEVLEEPQEPSDSEAGGRWREEDGQEHQEDGGQDDAKEVLEGEDSSHHETEDSKPEAAPAAPAAASTRGETEDSKPEAAPAVSAAASTRGETEDSKPKAALAEPAAASTCGPPRRRRETMKSRLVVDLHLDSGEYSVMLDTRAMHHRIQNILDVRERVMRDVASELSGGIWYSERPVGVCAAVKVLHEHWRVVEVRPADGLKYLVFDAALRKRTRAEYIRKWASTAEGWYFLHEKDHLKNQWVPIQWTSGSARFAIPKKAKAVLKTHSDHVFGGQTWFDILIQMGGCPAEFVEAWNSVINDRVKVALIKIIISLFN